MFFEQAPEPTAEMLAGADRLDAVAEDRKRREEESFQRCDTDGFLSQWALGIGARRDQLQAEILRHGGVAAFVVLIDAETNEVVATDPYRFKNQYTGGVDRKWKLPPEVEARKGRRWVPYGRKSRVQKQLGLFEDTRWFPARAEICGSGTGLSGAASAYVAAVKLEA